eukprot:COSAG01_NODE_12955_length_1657_cov_2.930680_1_plen_92_part_10
MAITKTLDEDTLRELKALWDQADADGSGELDQDEFEVVMEQLARSDWVETSDPQTGRTYFYNRNRSRACGALAKTAISCRVLQNSAESAEFS